MVPGGRRGELRMGIWERRLGLFLRIGGAVCLLAVAAVFMPRGWMDSLHQTLGLGKLPDGPIVEYLARSLSLFYAVLGLLLWYLGGHVDRQEKMIGWVGFGMIAGGAILLTIDSRSGLPTWWMTMEGPFVALIGLVILGLRAKARRSRW
jgi:hypothetical protein